MGTDTASARFFCNLLAIISALLIAFSCFGLVGSGLMKSSSYIASKFIEYDEEMLRAVNAELDKECSNMPAPAGAFTSALDKEDIDNALTRAAENLVLCYDIDFSDSRDLYDSFYNGIEEYCSKNSVGISSAELNQCASLGVKVTNEVLSTGISRKTQIFQLLIGNSVAMGFVYCAAGAVVCLVLINLINKRRHKKYSYYSLAFNGAGLIYIFGALLVKFKNYVDGFTFCRSALYDAALKDAVNSIINAYIIVGIAFVVFGLIMLVYNFKYYERRKKEMNETDAINNQMKKEFLEHYNKKHR